MTSLPWISIPTVALFFAEVRGYSKLYDSVDDSPLGQLKNILTSCQLFCNLVVSMKFLVLMWSMFFQVGLGSSWVWSPSCFSLTCVSTGFIASYIISSFTRWAQLCQSTITETQIWVQTFWFSLRCCNVDDQPICLHLSHMFPLFKGIWPCLTVYQGKQNIIICFSK